MNVRIGRTRLLDGLKKVQPASNAKGVMPIYGNVKVEAKDGKIALTTTDGDITLYTEMDGEVDEEGSTTIPIRRILPAMSCLTDGEVCLKAEGTNTVLTGGSYKANIGCIPADQFPKLPTNAPKTEFSVAGSELLRVLQCVSYAQSNDQTRRTLNGVLMSVKGDEFRCVATDGRRLAMATRDGEYSVAEPCEVIIPSRTVGVLQRFIGNSEKVDIRFIGSQLQMSFDGGTSCIYTRLIDDKYPNYRQVIPTVQMSRATVDRELLLSAIERVSILDLMGSSSVRMIFENGVLNLEIKSEDNCDANDNVPIKYDGEKVDALFDPKYVIDPLRSATSDVVCIDILDGKSPAVLRSEQDNAICILMPMRRN